MIRSHFTFGQDHVTTLELPRGGRLADYWVTVELPDKWHELPRDFFVREFTSRYCPRPSQFAFEYRDGELRRGYFPMGQLCVVTEEGVQGDAQGIPTTD